MGRRKIVETGQGHWSLSNWSLRRHLTGSKSNTWHSASSQTLHKSYCTFQPFLSFSGGLWPFVHFWAPFLVPVSEGPPTCPSPGSHPNEDDIENQTRMTSLPPSIIFQNCFFPTHDWAVFSHSWG